MTVPLTPEQAAIAENYAAAVSKLEVPGVDAAQKGAFFDFAVSEALQDLVDVRDEAQP